MKAKVLVAFQDLKEGAFRDAGSSFDLSDERFEEINNAGYGPLVQKDDLKQDIKKTVVNTDDLKKMKKDDLIEYAKNNKIKVREEDTKAEIIEKILGV